MREPRGAAGGAAALACAAAAALLFSSGCASSFQRISGKEAVGAEEFFASAAAVSFPVEASFSGVADLSGRTLPFIAGVNSRSPVDERVGFYDPLGRPVLFLSNDGTMVTFSRGSAGEEFPPGNLPPLESGPVSLGRILSGAPGYPVGAGELGRSPEGGWLYRDGRQRLYSDPSRRYLARAEYEFRGRRVVVSYPERETSGIPALVRVEAGGAKIVLRRDVE